MATIKDRYILEVETSGAKSKLGGISTAAAGLGASLGKIGPLAGAAAAAIGGIAAVQGIQNTINDMDNLAKSARLAGAAASEDGFQGFQVLQKAMGEAGVDAATFERGMLQLNTRLQQGVEGHKSYGEIVDKLGDRIKDQNGNLLTGADAMEAMINALNDGTVSTEDFAKVVGGRAGPVIQQQFASLQDGAQGLAATLADVEANSNIVSLESAENAEQFNDLMGRLGEQLGQVGTKIVEQLLPHLVNLADNVLANMPAIIDTVSGAFEALEPLFSLIGTVATDLVVPALQLIFEVLGKVANAISPLVEAAIPALKLAFETLGNIVSGIIDFFVGAAEALGRIYDRAVQLKDAVTGQFSGMKDSVVNSAKGAYDGVTGWFDEMYDEMVGNSIVPDMVNRVLQEFDTMDRGMDTSSRSAVTNVAGNFSALNSVIEQVVGPETARALRVVSREFDIFGDLVSGVFSRIAGFDLGSIFSGVGSIFGGGGGGILGGIASALSSVGSFVGDLFAGFFANGGMIPSGQFGVVGEKGPELVSGPATVTPITAGTSTQYVTYNINAVDAQSFRALVARDPAFIHAVAQQGAKKIPRRR